jgi:hypothetical protein
MKVNREFARPEFFLQLVCGDCLAKQPTLYMATTQLNQQAPLCFCFDTFGNKSQA